MGTSGKFTLLIVIAFAILMAAIFYQSRQHPARLKRISSVETVKLVTYPYIPSVEALGSVKSINGVMLKSDVSGRITDIHVRSGEKVKKGQLLVEIDPDATKAVLAYDNAQMQLDKINLQRDQTLLAQNAIDKVSVDTAKAKYRQDLAKIDEDQANLNNRMIKAPFSGTIGIINIKVGDYLESGNVLFSLQTLAPIYLDFSLPSQLQGRVKIGQTVTAKLSAYHNETFKGQVIAVNNRIDSSSNSIRVRALSSNKMLKLLPGDMVSLTLALEKAQAVIKVPSEAVVYDNGKTYLFTVDNHSIAHRHSVRLGSEVGDNAVIVRSGAQVGQSLVIAGANKLTDNQVVHIVSEKSKSGNDDNADEQGHV